MRVRWNVFLLLVFLGCGSNEEAPVVVPITFEPPEVGEFGVTVEQSAEHGKRYVEKIRNNTLEHKLPQIPVLDSNLVEINLAKLIEKPAFILVMDADCGFGRMHAEETFPKTWKRDSVDQSAFDVIFLVRTYRDQTPRTPKVQSFVKEMKGIYPNTYIILESDAKKMNATAVNTIFVNEDLIVKYFRFGAPLNDEHEPELFDHILKLADAEY